MGSMKEKRKNQVPAPYAAETKDVRFAGTFEVLVPVPERNKPQKVPLQSPPCPPPRTGFTVRKAKT
jgi:hypothetical protein